MRTPKEFHVLGLFGISDVRIKIPGSSLVLVGPNGIGKSTVSNIFYFFISRQWNRLAEYKFSSVALIFDDGQEITAAREDITGLSQIDNALNRLHPDSRFFGYIDKLRSEGLLEEFVAKGRNSLALRRRVAEVLEVSPDEARNVVMLLRRRIFVEEDDVSLFSKPRIEVEKKLSAIFNGRTLYLPTFRRIEKDIKDIFPDYEQRIRSSESSLTSPRSAPHYIDLVSFGMEDVRKSINKKLRFLRDYSLTQFNELSGLYLRDVIRGKAHEYSHKEISSLDDDRLSVILGRVSEQVLSQRDKDLLRDKIVGLKSRKAGPTELNESYLAHYFTRLMGVSSDISKQEADIVSFCDVCNEYLRPSKEMVYNDSRFTVEIVDAGGRPIDLSVLSSGEKQVVSLFAHLYLDESSDQIVVIDEPELSLSVPWQKRFIADIAESPHCRFVFAVTHSPFIYEKLPKNSAVDLRRYISSVAA
ncbi:AAA family ATPase [Qipengyuania sp. DY56-A-20]|jgi:energy-coupling factor transporter ATP-binding protein EcfA2|uniref:AAA family ATPase n=1 Tax=Qipengyuania benthica TaxID=3067651 RepID=A0ABT9HCD7_9SPHN|nr:AAA family ATPase [Qipengyuania sp. DY56-A-20]MDP4540967.1 AAA family ATPase [Qipengyuania sp. DY56-A-20]